MKTENNIIFGRNPVLTALKTKPGTIEKIYIRYGSQGKPIDDILYLSRKQKVPVSILDKDKFQKLEKETNSKNTQGVVAYLSIVNYYELSSIIFMNLFQTNPILLLLDKIQDPQNLGAIARTAECAGVNGLLLTSKDTAPINSTVLKASTGAILNIPIARVPSITKAIEALKKNGFWIIGTDPQAEINYWDTKYDIPLVLIIGNEGAGLSPAVKKMCDTLVKIPLYGKIESLNASVSAGVILYEIRRQRERVEQESHQQ